MFVKQGPIAGHPIVLNEYLASRLAHSMGIPVPFGELAALPDDERGWVSAIVGTEGKPSAPVDVAEAATNESHIYAGIAAFDVWILNGDRTDENLIWTAEIGMWAIDHEQAFGAVNPEGTNRLQVLQTTIDLSRVYQDAPPDRATMQPWIKAIWTHGAQWAQVATDAAYRRGLGSKKTMKQYADFLKFRAESIFYLVESTHKWRDDVLI
ncbi:HipA family kinase [Citricoccus sp. NPDC079358]|uniref:HipA family kinase n=1 Tax=Citricoccus sp. NPDC079358 TaxID=3154653 RepID=UPI00344F81D3